MVHSTTSAHICPKRTPRSPKRILRSPCLSKSQKETPDELLKFLATLLEPEPDFYGSSKAPRFISFQMPKINKEGCTQPLPYTLEQTLRTRRIGASSHLRRHNNVLSDPTGNLQKQPGFILTEIVCKRLSYTEHTTHRIIDQHRNSHRALHLSLFCS